MNILIKTCTHDEINFRLSSIMTIGYISQELDPSNITSNEGDEILTALIANLNNGMDNDVLTTTIMAFLNFIIFARKNFENQVKYIYLFI